MAENPYDRYNRLIGNRRGHPIQRVRPQLPDYSQGRARRIRRIARGSPTIPTEATSRFKSGFGSQYRSGATPAAQSDIWQNVYEDLLKDYTNSVAEQQAIETANMAEEQEAEDNHSDDWFGERIFNNVREFLGSEGFQESPVGRGMELLGRPASGVFEAMQSMLEHEDESWAPSNLLDTLQEGASGFVRGLTGEEITGFGDVYETWKNDPDSSIGNALANFEEAHPEIEQRISQAIGFGGEIYLDPLNAIFPSAPRVVRETGQAATAEVLQQTMLNAARDVATDYVNTASLNQPLYASNPQLLIDRIQNAVADSFNRSILETTTGGTRHTRLMNNRTFPVSVANRVEEEIREAMTGTFRDTVMDIVDNPANFGEPLIDAIRQYSDDFDEFWTKITDQLESTGRIPVGGAVDDVLQAISDGTVGPRTIDSIMDDVISKYEPELQRSRELMFSRTHNPTYRTIGIRVGNKQIPFKAVGRAYDFAKTRLNGKIPNSVDSSSRWFEQAFPGIFSLKTGRARAMGLNTIQSFKDDLRKIARDYTPEQARLLDDALANSSRPIDPHMAAGYDWLRSKYDEIFDDEVVNGVKADGAVRQDGYTYIFNRKGSKAAREKFRSGRKGAYADRRIQGPGQWTKAEAARMGLSPVDNAFENLLARYIKSRRDTVRASFLEDLVENYATLPGKPVFKLSKKAVRERNLHAVPTNMLPQSYRKMIRQGERFYIPQEFWNIYERFNKITSWSSSEWDTLGRQYARMINMLKKGLTIPYPGFHVKNMLGDVAMGLLDGINPQHYARWIKYWALNKLGRAPKIQIAPGLRMNFEDFLAEYHRNADAGFFSTEFGTYESMTAGKIPNRLTRRVADTATNIADNREMIPRFIHFATAFEQEAKALWKRGVRDIPTIRRKASDAALWRVNYYKFDYSALMPWEKGLKTLAFPFYTYIRKALPTLIEQAYSNPKYFGALSRFMQYNDGSASDVFNEWNVPDWIKEIGFAEITKEDEPWVVTSDILPLGAMDILGSSDLGELSRNTLGNLNPMLQAPIELATGTDLFQNRPDDSSGVEYLLENLPLLGDLQQEIGVPIPGLPGDTEGSYIDQLFGEGDVSWGSLMQNRFGLGLPVREISHEMQNQQQEENRDELIDDPLRQFNYSQDAYYISITDEFTYKLEDRLTGEDLGEFNSPIAAIQYAQNLPNAQYNQPFIPQNRVPTMEDVMTVIAEMQGR